MFSAGALEAAVAAARAIQLEDCRHPDLVAGRCMVCGRAILRPELDDADVHAELETYRVADHWFGECSCGVVVGESTSPSDLAGMHLAHRTIMAA